jgi:hypothetical protein
MQGLPWSLLSLRRLKLQEQHGKLQALAARIPSGANATLPPDTCRTLLSSAQGLTQQLSKLLGEQMK